MTNPDRLPTFENGGLLTPLRGRGIFVATLLFFQLLYTGHPREEALRLRAFCG